MSKKIEVAIVGDASKFKRELKEAEGATTTFGASLSKMKVLAAGAALGGLAVVTKFLKGSIAAAKEAQIAQMQLETQLRAMNISYKDHASAIEHAIDATSRLSGLDDEDLKNAFTNIVRVTGNVDSALKDMALAADIARGKHIDLASAGNLVAKVAGGNTGILARYGIVIEKGATATEALGILHEKFAGQAKAYGDSAAGATDRFHVAVENLQESVGTKLLPALTLMLNKGTDIANYLTTNLGPSVHRVIDALSQFKGEARFVANVLETILKAAVVVIKVNFQLYELQIRAVAAALNACKSAAQAVASFFEGAFRTAVNAAKTAVSFLDTALDGVKNAAVAVKNIIEGGLKAALNAVKGPLNVIKGIVDALAGALRSVAGAARDVASALSSIHVPHIGLPHIGLPHIPGFAKGGVVPGPVGSPMLAMVHGGETITPPGRGGAVYVTVNAPNYVGSKQELAEVVQRELLRINNRNTTLGFT